MGDDNIFFALVDEFPQFGAIIPPVKPRGDETASLPNSAPFSSPFFSDNPKTSETRENQPPTSPRRSGRKSPPATPRPRTRR